MAVNVRTIGKPMSLDKKPIWEKKGALTLPFEVTNKLTLMMHTNVAHGEHKGKEFRAIMDIGGRAIRLEYNNRHLDVSIRELVTAMMDEIQKY